MTTQFKALPRLSYHIHSDDPASDKPKSEQKRLKALAALDHVAGLANLLEFIELPTEGDKDAVAQRAAELVFGIHAIGEQIGVIVDSIYTALDEVNHEREEVMA